MVTGSMQREKLALRRDAVDPVARGDDPSCRSRTRVHARGLAGLCRAGARNQPASASRTPRSSRSPAAAQLAAWPRHPAGGPDPFVVAVEARPLLALTQRPSYLVGGALARAHRAVHVAGPDRRRLGPGPVDPPDRLAQRAAEVRPDAGWEVRRRSSRACPRLVGPRLLDVRRRLARPSAP